MTSTTARRDGAGFIIEREGKVVGRATAREDLAATLREADVSDKASAAVVRAMKRGPGGVATPD